jgi:hypothetical protein
MMGRSVEKKYLHRLGSVNLSSSRNWREGGVVDNSPNSMTHGPDQHYHPPIVGRAVRIAATGLGFFMLSIGGLSLWNLVAEQQWNYRHPAPGDFYSVEGKQKHTVCMGTGSPTVVMESAASARWTQWRKVQPGLSQVTGSAPTIARVMAERTPRRSARRGNHGPQLHSLLDQARRKEGRLSMRANLLGLYVREYAREFPTEIAGIALIDSSSPRQIDELPGFRRLLRRRQTGSPTNSMERPISRLVRMGAAAGSLHKRDECR